MALYACKAPFILQANPEAWSRGKVNPMSFAAYYSRILAQRKQGFPSAEEARRDFLAALAGLTPIRYS
jgi:hypothetical protein